jgi:SAM-dependent methyltransferase
MADHVEKLSNRRAFKRVDQRRVVEALHRSGATSVLDVGCGIGNTVARLLELGFEARGLTVNPDEAAASPVADLLEVADVQDRPALAGAPFDAAVSFDCLEHLERPLDGLRGINALLRPGGLLVCYIPPEKWTECDYHVIVYTPRQMAWLLNLAGFRLRDRRGRFRGKGVTYYATKESNGQIEPGKMR